MSVFFVIVEAGEIVEDCFEITAEVCELFFLFDQGIDFAVGDCLSKFFEGFYEIEDGYSSFGHVSLEPFDGALDDGIFLFLGDIPRIAEEVVIMFLILVLAVVLDKHLNEDFLPELVKFHLRAKLGQFDKLVLVSRDSGFYDGDLECMGDFMVVSVEDERLADQCVDVVEVFKEDKANIFDELLERKLLSLVVQFDYTFNQQSEVQFEVVFVFAVQFENILGYFFI